MQTLERFLFTATVLSIIAIIWFPVFWLQLSLTAIVVFFAACGIKGNREQNNQGRKDIK